MWVAGNGDPTKGLLWIVADIGKLMTTNTAAVLIRVMAKMSL